MDYLIWGWDWLSLRGVTISGIIFGSLLVAGILWQIKLPNPNDKKRYFCFKTFTMKDKE